MRKLTINVTDRTHLALQEAAARRGCTINGLIEEILELKVIASSAEVLEIVARARSSSGLSSEKAMAIAVRETSLDRAERGEQRGAL